MPADRVAAYIEQFRACLKDPDKPFAILARIPIKDGKQDKFEVAFAEAIAATRSEPGVLVYTLNRDAADGTLYVDYERWKTLSDLKAHLRKPYIAKLSMRPSPVLLSFRFRFRPGSDAGLRGRWLSGIRENALGIAPLSIPIPYSNSPQEAYD